MTKIKSILLFIAITAIGTTAFSQITHSVYAGWGMGTNLGGEAGFGAEILYKNISLNTAIGTWLGEFPEHTGDKSRYDYDFGVKLHSKFGVFLGINYGIIGESLYSKEGQDIMHFEKNHGFSFTTGYRRTIYKNIYGLGYLGLTSDRAENEIDIFGDKSFVPRMGIIIGYEFRKL